MLTYDQSGGDRLDCHLPGIIVEVDVGDLRLFRDNLAETLFHHLWIC